MFCFYSFNYCFVMRICCRSICVPLNFPADFRRSKMDKKSPEITNEFRVSVVEELVMKFQDALDSLKTYIFVRLLCRYSRYGPTAAASTDVLATDISTSNNPRRNPNFLQRR
ncbi:hypothetical protein ABFS82_09G052600 [Erythranthe guttata]